MSNTHENTNRSGSQSPRPITTEQRGYERRGVQPVFSHPLTHPLAASIKPRPAPSARLGVPPLGEFEDEAPSAQVVFPAHPPVRRSYQAQAQPSQPVWGSPLWGEFEDEA